MNSEIHYDANIFYVTLIIRTVKQGCSLDIDSHLFIDKVVEEIMFSDKALNTLMEQLNGNEFLINNEQDLRNLYLAKRDLVLLLEHVRGGELPFAKYLQQYEKRFAQIIYSQKSDMMEIDDMLNAHEQQNDKKNILVSEEYKILFDNND